MRRPSPWLALSLGAALLAAAGAVGEFRNPPGGDAASLLYGAARILDGAKLYRDLVDLNPPFVFLFHIPFVLAACLFRAFVLSCFRVGVLLLILTSLLTLIRVLRFSRAGRGTWHALVAAFLLGSLGLVVGFFGEREHLQFVLMFPYLALASLRAAGDHPPRGVAAWTGALAGVGLALKVTAGIVPVLVFGVLWLGRRVRSDESLWALGAMAFCTGAGLIWAPAYLETVRQFGEFYRGFALVPTVRLLAGPEMVFILLVVPLLVVLALPVMHFRLGSLMWWAAAAGFASSVLVQGKGFPYHFYPTRATTLTVLLLVLASAATRQGWRDALRRALAGAALLFAAAIPAAVAWQRLTAPPREVDDFALAAYRMLRAAPAGTTVAVESSRLGDAFPLVMQRDLVLTGRFPHLWFLYPYDSSAVYHGRGVRPYADSALSPLERQLRREVGVDLERGRPALLLVRAPDSARTVLHYLCDDATFRQAAARYRLSRADSVMQLFERDTREKAEGACASL